VLVASAESQLAGVGPAHIWVGLKNSDDVGTQFDLQVEVSIGNTVVAQGQTSASPASSATPTRPSTSSSRSPSSATAALPRAMSCA